MNGLIILRRARVSLLSLMGLISLTWATLFAIFLSHEWSHSSLSQRILVVCLLLLYVFTAILLYLTAVRVHFCPWCDVLKMFVVLVVQIGSSVLFTHYRPTFPCRGFDTETACKGLVFIIFIGSWVFSGITLCFASALIVMAFIPRPVEPDAALESLPLEETGEDDLPSNTNLFKAGSPSDERRTSLSIRTVLPVVTNNNGGELPWEPSPPDWNTSSVNSTHREIITVPSRMLQGFQSKDLRRSNETRTRGGTMFKRNGPGGSSRIGSAPQRADSFCQNFLSYSPTSRVPTNSRASMGKPAVRGKSTPSTAKVRSSRNSTSPKLRRDIFKLSPSLRNSHSLATMPRDRATENTPSVFSIYSNNSVLTSPWDDLRPTYPDHGRTTTPNVFGLPPPVTTPRNLATEYTPTLASVLSHYLAPTSPGGHSQREETYLDHARTTTHSASENDHSTEAGPTPYILHPSVPTPVVARFQDFSTFWSPRDISSGNNASFAAGGPNVPVMRSASQFRKTVQRSGERTVHRASVVPIKGDPFLRRGSDGQVLDKTQWWGLVKSAATKP